MSGITSGIGLASGINSQQIIEQLMQLEARPKTFIQTRVRDFQVQQAAILDINSRFGRLRDASKLFRDNKTFQLMKAQTADEKVMTATASAGAAPGTYQFIVDRLVTAQQSLSRGWASKDAALNATSIVVESAKARLDSDTSLADLNGGAGISRGKIVVTDSAGKSATVDLSKAGSVQDVLDAINNNGTAAVTAAVQDGKFIITDKGGGSGNVIVADAQGYTTATSLGIKGSAVAAASITGTDVYSLAAGTSLASLNDGNGVSIKPINTETGFNFTVQVVSGGVTKNVQVNLGDVYKIETVDGKPVSVKKEGAVTTVGGVLERINKAMDAQGLASVRAEIAPDGKRLRINDAAANSTISVIENGGSTASDLGLVGSQTNTLSGRRIISGLNSILTSSLNGGKGLSSGDGNLNFTTRDGFSFAIGGVFDDLSLDQVRKSIQDASGVGSNGKARLSVDLNAQGTGLTITDNTAGTGPLIIEGTSGSDTAAALKISTGPSGVATSTVNSGNLQKKYLSSATLLSSLRGGKGIGTGIFKITDSFGSTANVDIGDDSKTLGDVVDEINSRGLKIKASINANGDGISISEDVGVGTPGTSKIKIEDTTGAVAKALNLAGTASDVGASNVIDGTFERTIKFDATDTLSTITSKLNSAGAGVTASIINDGTGSSPYRLSLTSTSTGTAGRVIIDSGSLDLGLKSLETGQDARVFFGSSDPAKAVLVTSSSNTLDNVISNVKIDLKSTSTTPVSLTIASNTEGIKADVDNFITAFNDIISRIDSQSAYNSTTKAKGPLLGDSTVISLRQSLFQKIQGDSQGITGRYTRLTQIGIKVGAAGKLTLDETAFREALTNDPAAVEALFTAKTAAPASTDTNAPVTATTYTQLGIPGIIEELAKKYIDTVDGVLTNKNKSLDNQITASNSRIAQLDVRLAQKQARLEAQFAAMEKAISQLQGQQSALSGISAIR